MDLTGPSAEGEEEGQLVPGIWASPAVTQRAGLAGQSGLESLDSISFSGERPRLLPTASGRGPFGFLTLEAGCPELDFRAASALIT